MKKITFYNSQDNKLVGILSGPSPEQNRPVIVICHGFSSRKERATFAQLEQLLNQKDIATFRFDFYGHGESDGDFADITVSEAVDDILQAIAYLKGLGYKRIGLMGSSFGGLSSIMAASKTKDLFVLALKSPVSDYEEVEVQKRGAQGIKDWKEQGYDYYTSGDGRKLKLNYTFFEDFKNNLGYEAAAHINIPTLIVHGGADEIVPLEQSKTTAGLIPNCRLEIIGEANHDYSNSPGYFPRMLKTIADFLIKQSG